MTPEECIELIKKHFGPVTINGRYSPVITKKENIVYSIPADTYDYSKKAVISPKLQEANQLKIL